MAYTPHSFRVIDGLIPTRGANLPADLTLPTEPVVVVILLMEVEAVAAALETKQ